MNLLDKLEKRLRPIAIANLTNLLIAGQILVYILLKLEMVERETLQLIPARVFDGDYWTLFTFVFVPVFANPFLFLFGCYILHWIGSGLESNWGYVRYNIFFFAGCLGTVAAALLQGHFFAPEFPASTFYLYESLFLAFAYLYPDFEIHLYFVLPVKIKWLAWLAWAQILLAFFFGGVEIKLIVFASLLNYFLFFGKSIILGARSGHRRIKRQAERIREESQAFHRCGVCGKTDLTHPDTDFRYCPDCEGSVGYCSEHIHRHQCVKEASQQG